MEVVSDTNMQIFQLVIGVHSTRYLRPDGEEPFWFTWRQVAGATAGGLPAAHAGLLRQHSPVTRTVLPVLYHAHHRARLGTGPAVSTARPPLTWGDAYSLLLSGPVHTNRFTQVFCVLSDCEYYIFFSEQSQLKCMQASWTQVSLNLSGLVDV